MTPLDKTLKRSLSIRGVEFVVTLSPETVKLTRKGKRLGVELRWVDITSGESALAVALQASVGRFDPGLGAEHVKRGNGPKESTAASKAVPLRPRRSVGGLRKKRPRRKGISQPVT